MKLENYRYDNLPYSELVATYVDCFQELADCYAGNPFSDEEIRRYAEKYEYPGNRGKLVELLREFNAPYDPDPKARKNIDDLHHDDALVVVTGQQPIIYGGPLLVVHKAMSAVLTARRIHNITGRRVVPVFWLGDEDHDFREMSELKLPGSAGPASLAVDLKGTGYTRVSDVHLDGTFPVFRNRVREALQQTEFSDELWALLDHCYRDGTLWGEAFGNLLTRFFSKHGLVLAGSNNPSIKKFLHPVMEKAVAEADRIGASLEEQTRIFERHQRRQAGVDASLLFYVDEADGRHRLHKNNGHWQSSGERSWTTRELSDIAREHPERLSPNVFLRPLMQDFLLPNIAYIAGPGELAYYGQMKRLYQVFDRQEPFVIPRLSITFVEPAIARILGQVPFRWMEFSGRTEDLEKEFLKRSDEPDIEVLFSRWSQRLTGFREELRKEVVAVDPSLSGAVDSSTASFSKELDKLKGKMIRSVKSNQETQIKRIHRIQQSLFPERQWQEREIGFIYFMNKYGPDIWDRLLDLLEGEPADSHKLVYL